MLKALLKKQLLELNSFLINDKKSGKRRSNGSIIAFAILYAALFVFVAFVFVPVSISVSPLLSFPDYSWLYFTIMGLASILFGVFGSVFNTYAGLYHGKDNDLLLSMPIPPSKILFSRLVGVYLMGLLYSSLVSVPAAIIYWITVPISFFGIIFPILTVLINSFLILALTCALGWVVALISSKLKNKSYITVITFLIFFGIYYFGISKVSDLIEQLISNAAVVGDTLKTALYPFYLMGKSFVGDIFTFVLYLLIVAALFFLTYFILAKSFVKITTTAAAEKKKKYKEKKSKLSSVKSALFKKELFHFLHSPTYMLNCGIGLVFVPVSFVILLLRAGAFFELLEEFRVDVPEIYSYIAVLMSFVISLVISMNVISAPSISLEGKNLWILRSFPVSSWEILKSKQYLHILLNSFAAILGTVLAEILLKVDALTFISMLLFEIAFVFFTAAFGVFLNLKKPNLSWTNETVPIKQSMSVTVSLFGNFALSILFGALYFVVSFIPPFLYLTAVAVIFVLTTVLLEKWLYKKGTYILETL